MKEVIIWIVMITIICCYLHMEEAIFWMTMMVICSLTWRYFVLHTIEVTPGFQGVAIVGFPSLLTFRKKLLNCSIKFWVS